MSVPKSLAGSVLSIAALMGGFSPTLAESATDAGQAAPAQLSAAFRRATEKAQPSIVTIETYSGPRETLRWARQKTPSATVSDTDETPGYEIGGARDGEGTGIIFDPSGRILTCNHVVQGADMVFVKLHDGRRFEVKKVLQDPLADVAVVQIDGAGPLPAAELAAADALKVGDWVVTIGNPYGLGISTSSGVVSAMRRHLPHLPYTPLIQTDAATNPGNSGGALVDLDGRVVGMSEGGYGAHEGFQGIGFAIPISLAAKVADELVKEGEVKHPFFGFETEEVTAEIARYLRLKKKGGLLVCDVASESPAEKAGVHVGDVLTKVGETRIKDSFHFLELAEATFPMTTLTVLRAGNEISIEVTPEQSSFSPQAEQKRGEEETSSGFYDSRLGLAVDAFTSEIAKQLDYRAPIDGVVVTYVEPEGIAAKQGVCAGMSLLRVDDQSVRTTQEFRDAVEHASLEKGILMLVGTSRAKHFVLCEQ